MDWFNKLRGKDRNEPSARSAEGRIESALRSGATSLDLKWLSLSAVPESLRQLIQLEYLDISGNDGITSLPEWIGELSQLRSLDISGNQLTSLPESIGQLSQLQTLNLSHNQLSSLPESIGQLTQLQSLDIGENELNSVPGWIGQLTRCKLLSFYKNRLRGLPDSIASLESLETLSVGGNPITTLPDSTSRLVNLRNLCLSRTLITSLPSCVRALTRLEYLSVGSTSLVELPEWIGGLPQLKGLEAINNEETFIVVWGDTFKSWKTLRKEKPGSPGSLEILPESLRDLSVLQELYLHGNPGLGIPSEVLGPTWEETNAHGETARKQPAKPKDILDYYFRTRGGSRPLNEAKLILVGRGGVGKTCIVNRLVDHRFDASEKKTEGICITQWPVKLGGEEVRLHIWDFGGQEIMHSTHQFFLTQRSLYMLVLNGRSGGEDADAEYWLQLIESFGSDSPVIVVLNKIKEQPFDLNRRALQHKYPDIREFIETDCADQTGLATLDGAVRRETDRLDGLRDRFPTAWFKIKDRLAGMKENYLSFEQYQELCTQLGEQEPEAQERLAGYLHSLGVALNFKDDPRLRDTHVLNPRWITNGIYKTLNSAKLAAQKGVLRLTDLAEILDAKDYPRSKHLFLLDLMVKFELCFEFPDERNRYLVPELLDKQEPDLKGEFQPEQCLNFQYHYNIVPEGLLPRFIVRTHILSAGQARWRSGVALEFEGNRALVKADARDRKVTVSVTGLLEGRRRLLAVIRSDFEAIHRDIKKLQVEEMVPVSGRPEVVTPYSKLRVLEQKGKARFDEVIGDDVVELDVQAMLNGVDLEGTRRRPPSPQREQAVRVFISYSHEDEISRAKLETHLKLLQRQGMISVWTDRKIAGGEEWKDKIDENLETAAIILLLVSADFIASDYCYDKEMKRALERHEAGKAKVIPVIVRDVDWQPAPFGKLEALPKDGKPVTEWGQREDSAWKDIAAGIRKVAEQVGGAAPTSLSG
jgi:internalin A